MSTRLLRTKLYIPPIRATGQWVSRPRLIEQLNVGIRSGHKLILLSAPAGFGKTALLSEWVYGRKESSLPLKASYVSLDPGDNDLARFLTYLVSALLATEPRIGEEVLSHRGSSWPPPTAELLTTLINQISALVDVPSTPSGTSSPEDSAGAERRLVLILDDYHLITTEAIHDALAFLLEHLPSNMHVVIATRADPPLPIARLRGRGQLTELRLTDLRFTFEEVAAFLSQVAGLQLAADDLATLASRTEGWIAGVQMAALALQALVSSQDDAGRASAFIQTFTGSDRYILDYLAEEVLQRQPEAVQSFLLQTSVLDRLTGSLCDAVARVTQERENAQAPSTGALSLSSGQQILEHLERANLFIVPLDNERRWYRYHRLFADLLRQRLDDTQPDLAPTLHRRASEWYEQHAISLGESTLMTEAVDHALAARDFAHAAHLIEQIAEETLMRSETGTFASWIEKLPEELLQTRPSLAVYHAWALLMAGRSLGVVEARLGQAEGGEDRNTTGADVLHALVALFRGQMARAGELSQQALDELPQGDLLLRGLASWALGLTYMMSGDAETSRQILDEVAQQSQEAGNIVTAVMALCHLAELCRAQAQLLEAQTIYQQAQALARDVGGRPLPIAGMALIGLGELCREWNDLETAERYLREGIERMHTWGKLGALDGYISLARVKQAQGDWDDARHILHEAEQIAVASDASQLDDIVIASYRIRLEIARLWSQPAGTSSRQLTAPSQSAVRPVEDLAIPLHWIEERGLSVVACLAELDDADADRTRAIVRPYWRISEYTTLVRVLLAQGRAGEALTLLDRLLPAVEATRWSGIVLRVQILRALALSQTSLRAPEHSDTAGTQGRDQPRGHLGPALDVLEQALSLAELGGCVRMFVDEGHPMETLLRNALSAGLAPQYVRTLLAAFDSSRERAPITAPGPAGRASASPPQAIEHEALIETISPREYEVLEQVAKGLSNREIAQRLYISERTVKWHTSNLYGKLGVKNRTQAVAKARTLGILPAS